MDLGRVNLVELIEAIMSDWMAVTWGRREATTPPTLSFPDGSAAPAVTSIQSA
jgi:hypothetical protein